MSNPIDNLRNLNSLLASGKVGYEAGMLQASAEFKADSSISPFDFTDLNRRQTVVMFGGYLIAHKGFSAEFVYNFADVIYNKCAVIDLRATPDAIRISLTALDDQLNAENKAAVNKALFLGETSEKLAETILKNTKALAAAYVKQSTPKTRDRIESAIKELEALISREVESVATTKSEPVLTHA